jgi:hypothetical protein
MTDILPVARGQLRRGVQGTGGSSAGDTPADDHLTAPRARGVATLPEPLSREVPDDHHNPSAAPVAAAPVFTNTERLALARFLAVYGGLTSDLRAWTCAITRPGGSSSTTSASPGPPRRHRVLRSRPGSPRSRTSHRRPAAMDIAGFYRYAAEEELLDHCPAAHVRRPRLDYDSHAAGLDRNELGALLVAAGLGPPAEHGRLRVGFYPPVDRYRPDPPQFSEYSLAEHSSAPGWPHRAQYGWHRGDSERL